MYRPKDVANQPREEVDTTKVADQLDVIADLLTIEGANVLLSHSYRRVAARIKEIVPTPIEAAEFDRLILKIPGIGPDIISRIKTIAHEKHPNLLDVLSTIFPPTLTSLLLLPDLGPRRVNLLYNELGIDSIDDLEVAAAAGKLRPLPGFGPALEQRLLTTIKHRKMHFEYKPSTQT